MTLIADEINLNSVTANTTELISTSGSGMVTLKPKTAGVTINVGTSTDFASAPLEIGNLELDNITAPTLAIGDASSGSINVSSVIAPLNFKTLALGNNTTFAATGGFTADVTSASVFEKVTVTGTVNITAGAALTLNSAGGYIWNGTDTFTMLSNDAGDAITGTFTGPTLTTFLGSALTAQQSYTGGSGNDLVIGSLNSAPTDIALTNATLAENNTAGATIGTLTANDSDIADTHTFTFAGGVDDGVFTITGNTLTINGSADFETQSSYTIRIRSTDNGIGSLTYEENFTITITDVTIPQVINFGGLAGKTFGDAAFTVSATGGASGQSVTFSIFSGPATIAGNTVTITGAGSVSVRASQAGAGDYSAATPVD